MNKLYLKLYLIDIQLKQKIEFLKFIPDTLLPMNEEDRKYKYGQFGYGKYVYTKEQLDDMKDFFKTEIKAVFPNSIIKYVI